MNVEKKEFMWFGVVKKYFMEEVKFDFVIKGYVVLCGKEYNFVY